MICPQTKVVIELVVSFFEIITPLILLTWFLHSRWGKLKTEYYKEFPGKYGGWAKETINQTTDEIKFGGGTTMEIFDVDANGFFRGEFIYTEFGQKRGGIEIPYNMSTNFFTGKLVFRLTTLKRGNDPQLLNTNRVYFGEFLTVVMLNALQGNKKDVLKRVYHLEHYRESQFIYLMLENIIKADSIGLPKSFELQKSYNHLLDPYTTILKTRETALKIYNEKKTTR